ncbi:LacI family DNA-binding transcriptional regulator [Streptomyces incarnatus]|uniref:LacI family DNA-binding transcriptional regulator n=1 Tax=Streptomyces incarnatus TaxID=665007 RepID=UPI003CC5FD9E
MRRTPGGSAGGDDPGRGEGGRRVGVSACRRVGVSAVTVSHVINDHPHVRPATRERVLAAMARLDYRVNVAARNLRKGRTGTIGLAVPEVNRPYYGRLAEAIITAAGRHGLRVSIEQTGARRENEPAALSRSRNRLYDGLILSTVGMGPADVEALRTEYPVVILGERIFGGPVDHVAMPNVEASAAATGHLIERGCRRVAVVCGEPRDEVDVSGLRHSGYRQALAAAGLPEDPELVRSVPALTMAAGARQARAMVADGLDFDGVFCVTDTVAMGVLRPRGRGGAGAGAGQGDRFRQRRRERVPRPVAVHGGSGSRPDGGAGRRPARRAAGQCGSADGAGGVRRPVLAGDPGVDRRLIPSSLPDLPKVFRQAHNRLWQRGETRWCAQA